MNGGDKVECVDGSDDCFEAASKANGFGAIRSDLEHGEPLILTRLPLSGSCI
jgi:hypothetical protein